MSETIYIKCQPQVSVLRGLWKLDGLFINLVSNQVTYSSIFLYIKKAL